MYKLNLKRAVEYIKELNFNEQEINRINEIAKDIIQDKHFVRYSSRLTEISEKSENIEAFLKSTIDLLGAGDLPSLMKIIANDEIFLNYMQDMLLDKLL